MNASQALAMIESGRDDWRAPASFLGPLDMSIATKRRQFYDSRFSRGGKPSRRSSIKVFLAFGERARLGQGRSADWAIPARAEHASFFYRRFCGFGTGPASGLLLGWRGDAPPIVLRLFCVGLPVFSIMVMRQGGLSPGIWRRHALGYDAVLLPAILATTLDDRVQTTRAIFLSPLRGYACVRQAGFAPRD